MSATAANFVSANPPAARWQGLAIGVEEREGRFLYRVRMVHDEPVNGAVIVQTEDESEAIVAWRYWSASLRLPRLIENAPGQFQPLETGLGQLLVRPRAARRRGSPLFGRRSRRSAHRKVGRLDGQPVHAGEREIIARN